MKKRARRRLVGAAALALFAIIVLPMVMDREPRPLIQDIQVKIPSQDATGFAAKVIPGKPVATPMPAAEPVVEHKPDGKATATRAQSESGAAAAAAGPAAAVPTPLVAQAAPPAKAAEVEKKIETSAKPVSKPAAEGKPAGDASGQWVVQLGAFKEAGNVKLLLAKLKGIGVPAYTEKFDSAQGPRTRVRAGPFPSQEAAEKARARIKIIGVDGPVAPK
ncbi:MAG: SPOR domain-containing protein [Sulfuritalea sp.]|nr:SPOR domain-containing protein [Sulfuritalea sp.]